MKHTPGPWEMRELKGYQSSEPVFLIEGNTTLHLMVVAFPDGHVVGENEANARLIAAAPEMVSALQYIHDQYAGDWNDTDYKMIIDVINKTTAD